MAASIMLKTGCDGLPSADRIGLLQDQRVPIYFGIISFVRRRPVQVQFLRRHHQTTILFNQIVPVRWVKEVGHNGCTGFRPRRDGHIDGINGGVFINDERVQGNEIIGSVVWKNACHGTVIPSQLMFRDLDDPRCSIVIGVIIFGISVHLEF